MPTYTPQSLGIKAPNDGFKTGGWYSARQWWGGTLGEPGQIHPQSNQPGAGQAVNPEVVAASNLAQGLAPGANEAYIAAQQQQQRQAQPTPAPQSTPTQPTGLPAGAETGAVSGPPAPSQTPSIDLQSVYDQAFKTPEIDTANVGVSDVQAEIDTAQKAYDEAVAAINDNPLYSAATLTGKVSKLQSKFNADLNRLQNKKAMAQDNLAKLRADAEIKVNLAMKQYDINRQEYKDQLDLFNNLLSMGALTNASGSTIAQYAVATGIPTEMIQNIVNKQKRDEIKPQVITSTDDAGNVTVAIIDTYTGEVINKTSLGSIGKADKPTKPTTAENKEMYVNQAKVDARNGVTLQQMLQIYSPNYLSEDEVYSIYNANSVEGQGGYGPAKESPETLKQWGISVPGSGTPSPADEIIKLKEAGVIK